MWLLIQAEIKVNPCLQNGPQISNQPMLSYIHDAVKVIKSHLIKQQIW